MYEGNLTYQSNSTKSTDFLGTKFCKFSSDICTVSIVNYENRVSEEWHCHKNFHFSAILKGGNLKSRKKEDIQVSAGKLMFYHQGEIHARH